MLGISSTAFIRLSSNTTINIGYSYGSCRIRFSRRHNQSTSTVACVCVERYGYWSSALQQQQLAQADSEGGPSSCCQSAVKAYPGRVAASIADLQLVEAPRLFISLPGKAKPRWQIEKLDYTDC